MVQQALWPWFQDYCQAVQTVIYAGADVRTVIDGGSVGVLDIEAVDGMMRVRYITAETLVEQEAFVSGLIEFSVAFTEV